MMKYAAISLGTTTKKPPMRTNKNVPIGGLVIIKIIKSVFISHRTDAQKASIPPSFQCLLNFFNCILTEVSAFFQIREEMDNEGRIHLSN